MKKRKNHPPSLEWGAQAASVLGTVELQVCPVTEKMAH